MIHMPTGGAPSPIAKLVCLAIAAVALYGIAFCIYKLWSLEYGAGGREFDLNVAWPIFKKFVPSLREARLAWLDHVGGKYRWRKVVFTDAWIEEHLT